MTKQMGICLLAACALTTTLLATAGADSGTQRARRLVGTWTISNESTDPTYKGNTATGRVTFSDDHTMTIDDGGLAAAGLVNVSEPAMCFAQQGPISFKDLGTGANHMLYISWTGVARSGPSALFPQSAVLNIVKLNRKEAILVGQGGCGAVGTPRISYLTRVQ